MKKWGLLLAILIAVIWLWRSGPLSPAKIDAPSAQSTSLITESPIGSPATINPAKPPTQNEAFPVPFSFQSTSDVETLRSCVHNHAVLAALTKKDGFSLEELTAPSAGSKLTYEQRNAHFHWKGHPHRLMLLDEPNQGTKANVRFFKVDTDGFPTPVELPTPWKNKSQNEVLAILKQSVKIDTYQQRARKTVDKNTEISFYEENGQVRELLITLGVDEERRTLGCNLNELGKITCKCMK